MKNYFCPRSNYVIRLFFFILALFAIHWMAGEMVGRGAAVAKDGQGVTLFDNSHPFIQGAVAVQDRHSSGLMAIPGVVGTATGLDKDGRAVLLVFTKNEAGSEAIPENLEGIPVVKKITGEIRALKFSTMAEFPRPAPIGVSAGNEESCSAGTIGARVKDAFGNIYALSNNHVFALENAAPLGSKIFQPGLLDGQLGCTVIFPEDSIGTLDLFVPISFGGENRVDAAIALSSVDLLSNATPRAKGGYGIPSSSPVQASLGLKVQKFGRTTLLTKGKVTGINATIDVAYGAGVARFVNQIVIERNTPWKKAFSDFGDSGSLVVTQSGAHPVGLLFAGGSALNPGTERIEFVTFANPIDEVFAAFEDLGYTLAIDGL